MLGGCRGEGCGEDEVKGGGKAWTFWDISTLWIRGGGGEGFGFHLNQFPAMD